MQVVLSRRLGSSLTHRTFNFVKEKIMSKQSLLTLANFNLFSNTNAEIEFSIAKDNRVQAQYSAYDKAKGFDVRGIRAKSSAGKGYIRLSISMMDANNQREYHNGALFVNDKKLTDKQPDFQGSINLDNKSDGPKLRLSAWKKAGAKAGDYLSVSIQEFQVRDQSSTHGGSTSGGSFDMNGEVKPLAVRPTAARAPAVPATPASSVPTASEHDSEFDDPDFPF